MEVISSDWIYIAANGRSGAVGKSTRILEQTQGNICAGKGETTCVLTLTHDHTHTQHRPSYNLHLLTRSCICIATKPPLGVASSSTGVT